MKPRNWVRLVLILLIFTTALQIAGVIAPLWIFLTTDDFTVGVGLFFRIGCGASSGDNCLNPAFPTDLPFDYDSAHTYDKPGFVAIVWLETISACLGIILCIMMMVYAVGFGVWKKMSNLNTALVLTAILTWLPQVAGLIVYAVFYGKVISRSPDTSPASFPWSALMCFIAALLFIILTILIHARCKYRNYLKNAIPTSADSRMALNPLIKSQLMKRYFTPSPYREDRRHALSSSAYYTDQSQLLDHGFIGDAGNFVHTGYENRGFNSSRAIEYVTNTESRQDNNNRVIETNNLAAGTYGGNNGAVAVNNDFRGTVYEKDLGASVRQNTGGGTQVIERTYVTTTTTDQAQGDYGTRVNVNNYRPEVTEIRREQNWESRDFRTEAEDATLPVERVIGKNTLLDRHREYDAFSELDAETIYYTGKEGYTAGIDRREIANLGGGEQTYNRVIRTEVIEPPRQPPPPPPQTTTEEIVREVTVVERSGAMHRENRHFRIPADSEPKDALNSATHYTVHTKTATDGIPDRLGPLASGRPNGMGDLDDLGPSSRRPVSGEGPNPDFSNLTQVPNLLTGGDKFKYDGAHIYRPYAEESY